MTVEEHILYALLWASFGAVHSLLASERIKAAVKPEGRAYYRIGYNIVAGLHLGAILAVEALAFAEARAFAWPETTVYVLWGLQGAGWLALAFVLSEYDLGKFAGLDQAYARMRGEPVPDDEEDLHLGGVHRWVRHPLYTCLFVILWARVFNEAHLASAVYGSLYLVIGTYFEERKLLRRFGRVYADYRRQVPAYIPWRGPQGPFEGDA